MATLVINCGSSSVKFALFEGDHAVVTGLAERLGTPDAGARMIPHGGAAHDLLLRPGASHATALGAVFQAMRSHPELGGLAVTAIGHRVVHGGARFSAPVLLTPEVREEIRRLIPLAPLHNPHNLTGIEATGGLFPRLPQVAVFDTAFHHSLPPHVFHYALPERFHREHAIRRYGFHGTSHAWVAGRAVEILGLPRRHRLITAHLGYGCSVTAVRDGFSVDTSMGLTPLEGLVMGTRSGNVDPNLHEHLRRAAGMSLEETTHLLNHQSGLLGLTGHGDMRSITAQAAAGDERARLALDMFTFRLAREILGLCAALEGPPEALVFTGGIGENSALVRAETSRRLAALGVVLDPARNERHGRDSETRISPGGATPALLVIPTNEELAIATATRQLTGTL